MRIGSILEDQNHEKRIAITPEIAKKYISLGNISRLKAVERNILTFSIFSENNTPKKIPLIEAKNPIVKPVKKNDLIMEFSDSPIVLTIAISFDYFLF